MGTFVKQNVAAPVSGTYVEVGVGGGAIKRAQRIEAKQGETLPSLKEAKHQWLKTKN